VPSELKFLSSSAEFQLFYYIRRRNLKDGKPLFATGYSIPCQAQKNLPNIKKAKYRPCEALLVFVSKTKEGWVNRKTTLSIAGDINIGLHTALL
jgi:hypothetical protein